MHDLWVLNERAHLKFYILMHVLVAKDAKRVCSKECRNYIPWYVPFAVHRHIWVAQLQLDECK